MSNILDYIKWRGDITVSQSKFNEIDNLILSRVAYLPFDGIINEEEKITLKTAYDRFVYHIGKSAKVLQKEDLELFQLLADSKRFGTMYISDYENKISIEKEKQFSVVTIILPDIDTIYVSYRGTDNTIVGWKEDFNMSFQKLVPSQTDAVNYLEKISKKYNRQKIMIGGHSKGGNLAVYAAAFSNPKIQKRIIEVYNNDGPGFFEKVTETRAYQNIINKVHTYIPQASIIGRILYHEENTTILRSTQKGIMQHDLYSWQLLGTKFEYVESLTNESEIIDKTLKGYLTQIDQKQREEFIDILFDILKTTKVKTLSELSSKWFLNARIILKSYKNIDPKNKEILNQTLVALFNIAKGSITETIIKPKK